MSHRDFNEGLRVSAIALGAAAVVFILRDSWDMKEIERTVRQKNKKLDELSEKLKKIADRITGDSNQEGSK